MDSNQVGLFNKKNPKDTRRRPSKWINSTEQLKLIG